VGKETRERINAEVAANSFMRRRKERTMKRSKSILMASAVLAATLALPRLSTAAEGEASASLGFYSNYVWRGQTLSDGIVAQPTAGLSWKGLGVNIWANYDEELESVTETDFTLNYAGNYEKLSYDVGVIYYGLESIKDTTELYLGLSYDVILAPYATLYYDFDEGDGAFLVLGIGHSFPVTEGIGIDLGADVTVNLDNAIMGLDENGETFSGFYNADLTAGTSIPFAGAWSFDVLLAYSFALTDDSKAAISGASVDGEKDVFWGGAGVTLAF
jgi:uncharacterized protein (TIGR02001 family)